MSDWTDDETCPHCDGRGKIDIGRWYCEEVGEEPYSSSKTCDRCDGRGTVVAGGTREQRLLAAAPQMFAWLKRSVGTSDDEWDTEVRELIARIEGTS